MLPVLFVNVSVELAVINPVVNALILILFPPVILILGELNESV
tara:strand:- start:385 stop:513 length:129 start_codon:yes stop_codon:yes gene_type:complete